MPSRSSLLFVVAIVLTASPVRAEVPIMVERPATEPPVPRLRIGGELGGGIGYGATDGGTLGLFGHIGAQITRELGLFYQGAVVGHGFGDGEEFHTFAASQNTAMVDLTVRNVAQIGIGGGLDFGKFASCDEDTGICTMADDLQLHPSMSLRVAFLVGFVRNRARWGIPIALHAHTMLWEHRAQNHLMLTIGFTRY